MVCKIPSVELVFFCLQVVQALGNTTFEIVFLARLVGNVENTLFIHTSRGVYPYQVDLKVLNINILVLMCILIVVNDFIMICNSLTAKNFFLDFLLC